MEEEEEQMDETMNREEKRVRERENGERRYIHIHSFTQRSNEKRRILLQQQQRINQNREKREK